MKRTQHPTGQLSEALDSFWEAWQHYALLAERGLAFDAAEQLGIVEERGRRLKAALSARGL